METDICSLCSGMRDSERWDERRLSGMAFKNVMKLSNLPQNQRENGVTKPTAVGDDGFFVNI